MELSSGITVAQLVKHGKSSVLHVTYALTGEAVGGGMCKCVSS